MIKDTISLTRKTLCDCPAYPYPHAVGAGKCDQHIEAAPPFIPPKRGLAAKLCKFIDDLDAELDNDQDIEAIANLIISFKNDLYGCRDVETQQVLFKQEI